MPEDVAQDLALLVALLAGGAAGDDDALGVRDDPRKDTGLRESWHQPVVVDSPQVVTVTNFPEVQQVVSNDRLNASRFRSTVSSCLLLPVKPEEAYTAVTGRVFRRSFFTDEAGSAERPLRRG